MLFHQVLADETAYTASCDHCPVLNSHIGNLTVAKSKSPVPASHGVFHINGFVSMPMKVCNF